MQKKVWGDHTPSYFFFAKPDVTGLSMAAFKHVTLVLLTFVQSPADSKDHLHCLN